jgi:UDP-N-acetylmuramate-alanine ligase
MNGDRAAVVTFLCESTRSGDLVLTLGAGDVGALGAEVLARLGGTGAEPERR